MTKILEKCFIIISGRLGFLTIYFVTKFEPWLLKTNELTSKIPVDYDYGDQYTDGVHDERKQ